jgi:hypothetical protein
VAGAEPGEEAVEVNTIPASPPAELTEEFSVAARAYDELAADGRRLHFAVNRATGRVTVEVHDLSGKVLSTVSPSQALAVAAGGSLG